MPLSELCINGPHLPISLIGRMMEKGSESPIGSFNEAWKDEIDATKAGAGYFLSLKGRPEFNPLDYISFRGLVWSEAPCLPSEWVGWMQDLKVSTFEHVRRRALTAPALTFHDVYNVYKVRILDRHELEILGESSQQVVDSGHQPSSLMQERQRHTEHITPRTSTPTSSLGQDTLRAISSAANRSKGKAVAAPNATGVEIAIGSHERVKTNQTTDALNDLEVDHRKRRATESESARKTKSRKKAPNGDLKAAIHKTHTQSRIRRYKLLDKKLFWQLKSGRAVETVLHEASLQPAATTR
ncbi:hypothetical protein BGW38_008246 [Lunasporangiospora selenospora]|uniref:Uncharacterized protein n=1 Tax=Lunasporangiospora selenospora TaxID=979761 RepID=A0A9P6FK42_9FUNG|nr:hypothetical protein BGW38_008246 [Lunasporangiospora selenospora]